MTSRQLREQAGIDAATPLETWQAAHAHGEISQQSTGVNGAGLQPRYALVCDQCGARRVVLS